MTFGMLLTLTQVQAPMLNFPIFIVQDLTHMAKLTIPYGVHAASLTVLVCSNILKDMKDICTEGCPLWWTLAIWHKRFSLHS